MVQKPAIGSRTREEIRRVIMEHEGMNKPHSGDGDTANSPHQPSSQDYDIRA